MAGLIQGIVSRCAAAAVALLLSGAPDLIEPPSHSASHRCHCPIKNGRHDCDCPLCQAEASRAAGADQSVPACHRVVATKARAQSEEAARRRSTSGPCLTGTCGTADGQARPPPTVERYTVPPGWHLALVLLTTEVAESNDLVILPLREPETPPPRAA